MAPSFMFYAKEYDGDAYGGLRLRYQVTFPLGRQCTLIFATGAETEPGCTSTIVCALWTRIDIERQPSPSEAIIDSQSVAVCGNGESSSRLRCRQTASLGASGF